MWELWDEVRFPIADMPSAAIGFRRLAGKAEYGGRLGDKVGVLAGGEEGLPGRLDDVGARAGEVGADVGGAALGAADDGAVRGRKGRPAAGAAAIYAKHEIHGMSPPGR